MDLAARIFFLRVIDVLMEVALQRPIAAGGVRVKPTARSYRDVGRLLYCPHRFMPFLRSYKPREIERAQFAVAPQLTVVTNPSAYSTGARRGDAGGWARVKSGFIFPIR